MCGSLISNLFGGGRSAPPAPPGPAPPTPPPMPVQTAPRPPPTAATPTPISEDETKRKAKVTSKKVQKKSGAQGTSQLATKKPTTGGLQGIKTPHGVNPTGGGGGTGGSY